MTRSHRTAHGIVWIVAVMVLAVIMTLSVLVKPEPSRSVNAQLPASGDVAVQAGERLDERPEEGRP